MNINMADSSDEEAAAIAITLAVMLKKKRTRETEKAEYMDEALFTKTGTAWGV